MSYPNQTPYGAPPPGGGGGYGPPPGGGFGGPPGPPGPPGGYPGPQPGFSPQGPVTHQLALITMIAGLVGLPLGFCCSFFGFPIWIATIIMGIISLQKIKAEPQRYKGKEMAIVGIICAGIGVAVFILAMALGAAGAILGAMNPASTHPVGTTTVHHK